MFTRATGSKSKTLIASFGLLIRSSALSGAQMIGSGSLEGAVGPSAAKAEKPPPAYNGLPARNRRNRRRLADGSIGDDMADLLPGVICAVPRGSWLKRSTRAAR